MLIDVKNCFGRKKYFITFADLNVPWCNGNTPVFGTVIQGSNPCGTTLNNSNPEEIFLLFLWGFSLLLILLKGGSDLNGLSIIKKPAIPLWNSRLKIKVFYKLKISS